MDSRELSNYRPMSNLPFLDKVPEHAVALQLQAFLYETDYLDLLRSGFRPGLRDETYFGKDFDMGRVSLLSLPDLSAA